jgi:hypothetical protein
MAELHQKKMKLESLVNDFQDRNEEYLNVIKSVGEEVLSALPNVKVLLRCALLSITESIRNNPERFRSIFYNISLITDYCSSQDYTDSYMSPDNNTEANAAVIVDEAEKLYNKVVKDCINKAIIIIDHPFSKPSSLPLLSPSNEEQKSYESS